MTVMAGAVTRARSLLDALRSAGIFGGRRLSWRNGGVFGILALLVVAAFASDGFRSAKVDLNEAGVWVTNQQEAVAGRINMQTAKIEVSAKVSVALDVVQEGRNVATVDPGKSLRVIDVATGEVDQKSDVPLPAKSSVGMGGGQVAITDLATGSVWVAPFAEIGSIKATPDAGGGDEKGKASGMTRPTARLGRGAVVGVGPTGTVIGVDITKGRIRRISGPGDGPSSATLRVRSPQAGSALELVVVGTRPVVFDPASMRIQLQDRTVDLSAFGTAGHLQAGPATGTKVMVATERGVVAVPLDDGDPTWALKASGVDPIRPVVVGGCLWSAWRGDQGSEMTEVVRCRNGRNQVTSGKLPAGAEMTFRVNGPHVALNAPEDGRSLVYVDKEFVTVSEWPEPNPDPTSQKDEEDKQEKGAGDTDCNPAGENVPPRPTDDVGEAQFGARPFTATVLAVLANDEDANCDVLSVTKVTDIAPPVADVVPIDRGHAVQFTNTETYRGPVTFTYWVTDGRSEPIAAKASVMVRGPDEQNHPPEQRGGPAKVTVERNASVTYNVLSSFNDPDGDPLVLDGARSTVGHVTSQSDGTVVFSDDGTPIGSIDVALDVSDGSTSVGGVLRVEVVDHVPPVARNDHAVGLVGVAISIDPIANDSGSGNEPIRLVGVDSVPQGTTALPDSHSGTVVFTANASGSYRLRYTIASGSEQAQGWIRVDVSDKSLANRPPVAVRDVVSVVAGSSSVVDLIANDSDPDFDVLVVQSIEIPSGADLTAQLIDQRAVRVHAAAASTSQQVVTYWLSDGVERVQGQLLVLTLAGGQLNQPPVARDDAAVVRAGDVVSIPVLANDSDPEGSALKVSVNPDPALAFNPPPGSAPPGEVFSDGVTVRFVAGAEPTSVSINYSVIDDAQNTHSGLVRVVVIANDEHNTAPVPRSFDVRTLGTNSVEIHPPVVGIDPDGDSVTLSLGPPNPAAKGTVVFDDVHCACFVYTPAAGQVGTDTFTYVATDSRGAPGTAVIRVGVAPRDGNQPPIAVADQVSIRPGRRKSIPVTKNDFDNDRDPITLESVTPWTKDSPVSAHVSDGSVVVRGPDGSSANFGYTISDGQGGSATGTLTVTVSDEAPKLPPVARDDGPDTCKSTDKAVAVCSVLTNDDDPDGNKSDLNIVVPARYTGVTVDNSRKLVKVRLTSQPQVITYTITDPDSLSSSAVLRVPAAKTESTDLPPVPKDGPLVAVELGSFVNVEVGPYAKDPEGKPILLGSTAIAFARGSATVVSPTAFRLAPGEGAVGDTTVSFQVTDGVDSTQGNHVTITVPVRVNGKANTAPTFAATPIDVAVGDDPISRDLRDFANDTDPGDEVSVTKLAGAPKGLDASLDDSKLTLAAGSELKKGDTATLTVSVSDGTAEVPGQVLIRIVASTRPKVTANLDERDAEVGKELKIDVLTNDVADPKLAPLKVVGATAAANMGSIRFDDTTVFFTPSAEFGGGTVDLSYVVNDKLNDEDRKVAGTIRVTVKDRPKQPTAPTPLQSGAEFVVLKWDPPAAQGEPITKYEVKSVDGSVTKETSGPVTQLSLTSDDGVKNDRTYRFIVRAFNKVGWSDESPPSQEVVVDQRPDASTAPPQLTYDPALSGGELMVTWPTAGSAQWTNNGSEVQQYQLEVSPSDASGSLTFGASTTSTKLTGLRNGVNYTVRVRARNNSNRIANNDGWSDWSPMSAEMFPAAKPNAVSRPSATRIDDPLGERIQVTWARPVHNTREDDCCDYRIVTTGSAGAPSVGDVLVTANRNATITQNVTAPKGYTYTFQVFAKNKAGEGPASQPSVGVASFTRPDAVTGVSALANGTNSTVILNFTPPSANGDPIDNYQVQVSSSDGGAGTGNRSVAGPGVAINGLSNGRHYTFAVQACNQGSNLNYCSPTSTASGSVVPYGPPSAPSVGAGHTGGNNINLTWNGANSGNGAPVDAVEISIDGGGWQRVGVSGSTDRNSGCATSHSIQARAISGGRTGPPNSTGADAPACPPPPSVTLNWGNGTSVAGCTANCNRMVFTVDNFPAGKSLATSCQYNTGSGWRSDFGYDPPDITTDGNGHGWSGDRWNCVGSPSGNWTYRVVVDGVASNEIG